MMFYVRNEVYKILRTIDLAAASAPPGLKDRISEFLKEIDEKVMVLAWSNKNCIYEAEYMGYRFEATLLRFKTGDLYDWTIRRLDSNEVVKTSASKTLKKAEYEMIKHIDTKEPILV